MTGGPAGQEGSASRALRRATRALQEEPDGAWPDVADRVASSVRSVSRPGRPLLVAGSPAGVLRVDQRVVVDLVRRALAAVPGCRPVDVAVVATGQQVDRVRVEVWARYGVDVRALAEQVRTATAAALDDVLAAPCPVDVAVVDVEPA